MPPSSARSSIASPEAGSSTLAHRPARRMGAQRARREALSAPSARRTRSGRSFAGFSPSGIPFDEVEILHTDASTYPALRWEFSREHDVPCTFAGGRRGAIHAARTGGPRLPELDRPGIRGRRPSRSASPRAPSRSNGWPGHADGAHGTRAAARAFREAHIGWGARRHRTPSTASSPRSKSRSDRGRDAKSRRAPKSRARAERRRRRLAAARRARDFAARALGSRRRPRTSRATCAPLARGCRSSSREFARVGDEIDGSALTALDKLLEELEVLPATKLSPAEAGAAACRRRPRALDRRRPAATRPRPRRRLARRRILRAAGTRISLGLDEARHPGRRPRGPGAPRRRAPRHQRGARPPALPLTATARATPRAPCSRASPAFRGALTACYSSWNLRSLDQQSEQFPSPFFLDLYRASSGRARGRLQRAARGPARRRPVSCPASTRRSTRRNGGSRGSRRRPGRGRGRRRAHRPLLLSAPARRPPRGTASDSEAFTI